MSVVVGFSSGRRGKGFGAILVDWMPWHCWFMCSFVVAAGLGVHLFSVALENLGR